MGEMHTQVEQALADFQVTKSARTCITAGAHPTRTPAVNHFLYRRRSVLRRGGLCPDHTLCACGLALSVLNSA